MLKHPVHKIDDEYIQRGFRLSFAIKMTGLTRKKFSATTEIPVNTLRSWEQPQRNSAALKEKSAERVVHALFKCGVIITKSWLLFGIGNSPLLTESAKKAFLATDLNIEQPILDNPQSDEECIIQEIELFKRLHSNAVITILSDNSMEPFYSAFDYVAGLKQQENFPQFEGRNCIIQIKGEESPHVARFRYNQKANLATVYTINILTTAEIHQWIDVQLEYVAEIIFHRKRELQSKEIA
jgi:hypothetical protein